MHPYNLRAFSLCLGLAIAAAGCGGSDSPSPAAPTPTEAAGPPAPAPAPSLGATVSGTVTDRASAQALALGQAQLLAGMSGVRVSADGGPTATTGPGGAFELRGVPAGRVRLRFDAPRASGTLEIADVSQTETITLTVVVSGSTVELESQQRETGSQAQLEGKVLSANHAARSLVVGTTTVMVPEGTPITNGNRELDLTDVVVGARVHVKGARTGDTLTATRVMVQQTGLERVNLSGDLSNLAGACPDATFRFGSTAIAVNSSTIFVQGSCSALAGGLSLEVKGLRRADGSVLATMVRFTRGGGDDDDDDEEGGGGLVDVTGAITSLGGTCPARTFQAGDRQVRTTGATTFQTPCATLANGQTVQVKGRATGNGTVMASEVK